MANVPRLSLQDMCLRACVRWCGERGDQYTLISSCWIRGAHSRTEEVFVVGVLRVSGGGCGGGRIVSG